jgi:hypothetical protein
MEHIKDIENVQDIQALRISGALYLLGKLQGYPVFDIGSCDYDESLLIKALFEKKIPEVLLERWRHYEKKNNREKMRYHEGLFYDLYIKLSKKEMNQDVFLKKVRDLFVGEMNFLKKVNFSSQLKFHFPVNESGGCSPKIKKEILKDDVSDIRITYEKDRFWFKNKKALYLNEREKSEGIFIAGSTGSGKTMASISLLSQIIIKGGGGLYLTHDHVSHWHIASALKEAGRLDDLLIYNMNSISDFLTLDIPSLVKHNKVIVFYMYALEKDPWSEETLEFIDQLHQFLFLKIQEVETLNCNNHFMIVFEELLPYLFRNNKEMFALLNGLLEKKNIIKVYNQQDMDYAEVSQPFIKHYFMMKQDDPCCKFIGSTLDRDLRMLRPGDFFYTKDLKNMNKSLSYHTFMYLDLDKIKNFYVNMF